MTYRERREARAERLREWAEKRRTTADSLRATVAPYRGDTAFWTQPGNIPERTRLYARMDRAAENSTKAASMEARAAGIERAAERAIYGDDPDAAEALTARIADLEASRERMKADNTLYRAILRRAKGSTDQTPAEAQEAVLRYAVTAGELPASVFALASRNRATWRRETWDTLPHEAFELTNLGGNIRRNRDRLAALANPAPKLARTIIARRAGRCEDCPNPIKPGDYITEAESRVWVHRDPCAVTRGVVEPWAPEPRPWEETTATA